MKNWFSDSLLWATWWCLGRRAPILCTFPSGRQTCWKAQHCACYSSWNHCRRSQHLIMLWYTQCVLHTYPLVIFFKSASPNLTWHVTKPSRRCLFLGRWLNRQVPLMILKYDNHKNNCVGQKKGLKEKVDIHHFSACFIFFFCPQPVHGDLLHSVNLYLSLYHCIVLPKDANCIEIDID